MEFLRTFFALNRDIVFFAYGLVFFVLGLAIALQSRSYSRLDLARSLKWLAAFGFTHGFHEWGDLFIPIQSIYMSDITVEMLHVVHLLLLAASYAFLFEFGVALLRPLDTKLKLNGVSTLLMAIWIFVVFFPLRRIFPDSDMWYNTSNALARYFIGFPGGLLAAYGLRIHAFQRILPLNVPDIVKMLRFAGLMLACYAVFGGLIAPPAPIFPANSFNSVSFEQALIAPPPVFRSLIGLGLVIAIIRALEIFDVETDRMIESMEQSQILAVERNRIARDLHDGAIQKVYTAGLLVESARKLADEGNPALSERLLKVENVLNDAIHDLRGYMSELQPRPSEESIEKGLEKLAKDPRFHPLVDIKLDLDIHSPDSFSATGVEHVLAIVSEALSNVIRHARASKVVISTRLHNGNFILKIQDDGVGIPEDYEAGYGLRNMRDRARLLNGNLSITDLGEKGTLITLEIPWKEDR